MDKKIKLCYIAPANTIVTERWVRYFVEKGYEIYIITIEPGNVKGVTQIDLSSSIKKPKKLNRFISFLKVRKTIQKIKPHLIHIHYLKGLAWGILLSRFHPLVVTPWGSDILADQGAFNDFYAFFFTSRVLEKADLVTVHSNFMKDSVKKLGGFNHKIQHVGWGVDLTKFQPGLETKPLKMRLGLKEGQSVILSLRCPAFIYNIDLIIKAMPFILKMVPDTILLIAEYLADVEYLSHLKNLVDDLNLLENVRFIGALNYNEVPFYMNIADVVVSIPSSDGMPSTILETMACGTPLVLSDLLQYKELIKNGVNGLYVDIKDIEGLADSVIKILVNPSLREQMKKINIDIVRQRADYHKEMAKMERLYNELIGVQCAE